MNILITINKKYIKQVNILLNSIQYFNTKESFNIYVLHRDLEESDLKIINNNLDLTGVLLMNLKALRKINIEKKVITFVKNNEKNYYYQTTTLLYRCMEIKLN